ncbi:MAG TPA: DICT sensory domain-containing protein [Chloroflexia bacterium]|nr:DICT sensory domain-containing protein [Chloroflexia bacterium]
MKQKTNSLYQTLFERFSDRFQPQEQRKPTLTVLSHILEDEILESGLNPVIFTSFQDVRYYNYELERYRRLRSQARALTIFGRDLPGEIFFDNDWFVVINEPRFKVALVSQEAAQNPHEQTSREKSRAFQGIWSYDPDVVDFACQFLSEYAEKAVTKALYEVLEMPYQPDAQVVFARNVSGRILNEMEKVNTRLATQTSTEKVTEQERNKLLGELKLLYAELTRSQFVATQALMDQAHYEKVFQGVTEVVAQLKVQVQTPRDNGQPLELLTRLESLLASLPKRA